MIGCKMNPNYHPSSAVLDCWYEVFVLMYSPNVGSSIMANLLSLVSSVQTTLFQSLAVCSDVQT